MAKFIIPDSLSRISAMMFKAKHPKQKARFSLPSNFLSLRLALWLLLSDLFAGIIGFSLLEEYNLLDAVYMTIITISTVGFTEVHPLGPTGRIFTSCLILFNIGIIAYVLAVFSYYIIQGEIFKNLHTLMIERQISRLENHVILCGYGKYGKEISQHFHDHDLPFVVIEQDEAKIDLMRKGDEKMLYIQEDATHDEALVNAGISKATAIISALPDDSDNLFIVLSARQINPKIKIISRAKDPRSQKKLFKAGANHVVMPEQIGGFYMATLVSKPGAVEFFSFITNEYQSDIGFEEISFDHVPARCQGKSIAELHLRRETGANIIGYKNALGKYLVNPEPQTVLMPGSSFIVLGNQVQLNAIKEYFNRISRE